MEENIGDDAAYTRLDLAVVQCTRRNEQCQNETRVRIRARPCRACVIIVVESRRRLRHRKKQKKKNKKPVKTPFTSRNISKSSKSRHFGGSTFYKRYCADPAQRVPPAAGACVDRVRFRHEKLTRNNKTFRAINTRGIVIQLSEMTKFRETRVIIYTAVVIITDNDNVRDPVHNPVCA